MKDVTVFFQVVNGKFFVVYMYDKTNNTFEKRDDVFDKVDEMVRWYSDDRSGGKKVDFVLIN